MNWLVLFMQLLPTLIVTAEKAGAHLQGKQKKAAVTDVLNGVASGFAVALPEHAAAAQLAANTAVASIDGVVSVLNAEGLLKGAETGQVAAVALKISAGVADPVKAPAK